MSDNLRKDFGDQVHDKVKPDSQKPYTEPAIDTITGAADKVGAALQPEGEKSTTQKMGDATRGNVDGAQDSGTSVVDKAKDAASGATMSLADAIAATTTSLEGKSNEANAETGKTTST